MMEAVKIKAAFLYPDIFLPERRQRQCYGADQYGRKTGIAYRGRPDQFA